MINTNIEFFKYEEGWNIVEKTIMTVLGKTERTAFWNYTKVYGELYELLYIARSNKREEGWEEIVKDFISLIEEKREYLEALLAEGEQELEEIEKQEAERKADDEAFAARWGFSRNHISGRYMHYVKSVDLLAKDTWTEYDNKYIIQVEEVADYDWNYYAKSYGHPKKTVTARKVVVYKKGTGFYDGSLVVAKQAEIESFRSNNILRALADLFKIKMPAANKLQTNKFYEIKKVNKNLYCQKFGKQTVGYVAIDGDITYHAQTAELAKSGLANKIALLAEATKREQHTTYTAELLHEKFGFCNQGMREFCAAADLDINKEYSIAELKSAAKRVGKEIRSKYSVEVNILLKL